MKYSVELYNGKNHFAGYKAVEDAKKIVHSMGYIPFPLTGVRHPNNFIRYCYTALHVLRILVFVRRNDICFLQWPMLTPSDRYLFYAFKKRCKHLQILIHDLTSVRTKENYVVEMKYMESAEMLIVHTTYMEQYLESVGICKSKMRVLTAFDYLLPNQKYPIRTNSRDVVFAGHLTKSKFLDYIMNGVVNIPLICYGECNSELKSPLIYKGVFHPDYVSSIQGSWGLVWDGDSVDGCGGLLGSYLRLNSPHKLSLYIVARLPVIVWNQSALARYVLEKGLGLCISRLIEIKDIVSHISNEEYSNYLANIDKEREQLLQGNHLRSCLI